MKVTVERTPESEAVLNVELEWSELEKASDRAYRKLVQKYNVPGFRRGHAPRSMLERMLGNDALYQEGLEDLIDESVRSAVREHHLRPLTRPSVEAPPIEHGQPYTFTARLPVLTPVKLGEYQSIRVTRPTTEVTEDEIQKVLGDLQRDNTLWLPAERPAQMGDKTVVDLKVTVGDRTISDLHDNEFELASERHGIFTGMDEQIVGMREGETKEFTTTIPADYANTELAGKDANFTVTIKGVKYQELPALDDELAKTVGDFSTLDEVREAIRDQLLQQKQSAVQRELRDQVLTALAEQSTVEVHPVLVDDEVHTMMRETERSLSQNRLSLQQYLSMTKKSEEQYHTELEPEARERVKRDLLLSAVADAENITVTDAEIEGWLMVISAVGGGKPIQLRQLNKNQRENVEIRIQRDKALDRLITLATADADADSTVVSEANASAAASASAEDAMPSGREEESPNAGQQTTAGASEPSARTATIAATTELAAGAGAGERAAEQDGDAEQQAKNTEVPESAN